MTVQVVKAEHGKSKAALLAAVEAGAEKVWFRRPTPWGDEEFSAAGIKPHERFPVVMDPATRRRFAEIERRPDGSFRVR